MSTTATRPQITRLVGNHKQIDQLIRSHPDCPRNVSYQVDALLVEAEAIRAFYLR